MNRHFNFILLIILFSCYTLSAQQYSIEIVHDSLNTSIRGLSVVNDKVIWVCGNHGFTGRSIDGGTTWHFNQILHFDSAEFRDIEAFDELNAVVMSSVQPACILKTTDGGNTWKEVFRDDNPEIFLDAIDFQGKKGVCIGDPVDGHFLTLYSANAGKTWKENSTCKAPDSVYAFAASGSTIQFAGNKFIAFGTGGRFASLYYSTDRGKTWNINGPDIIHGNPSQGIFSIDFSDEGHCAVAGGDYLVPEDTTLNFGLNMNVLPIPALNGTGWVTKGSYPKGYRSCIKFIDNRTLIACGSNGVDMAIEGNWFSISKTGFHVIGVSPDGRTIFLAGSNGRIAKLIEE